MREKYLAKKQKEANMTFTAYNHNDTGLCEPTTRQAAIKESKEYTFATGNESYVANSKGEIVHENVRGY